jgi:hypothetical protein
MIGVGTLHSKNAWVPRAGAESAEDSTASPATFLSLQRKTCGDLTCYFLEVNANGVSTNHRIIAKQNAYWYTNRSI